MIIEYALQPNHSEWSSFIAQFETKEKAKEVYEKLISWIKEETDKYKKLDCSSGLQVFGSKKDADKFVVICKKR